MNNETYKALGNLAILCAQLNRKNFAVFYRYSGHTDIVDVSVYADGWSKDAGSHQVAWFNVNSDLVAEQIEHATLTLKKLSEENIFKYSPENQAKLKAERAAELIEERKRLHAEIKALGGDTLVCNDE